MIESPPGGADVEVVVAISAPPGSTQYITAEEFTRRANEELGDKAKVTFPVYWVGDAAVDKFDIYAVPMLFFIKDGRVVDKIPGKRSKSYIEKKIKKLLK